MLLLTIIIVFIAWIAVAMAYAIKLDNALYYEYPKMSNKEIKRIAIYVFFWFIFFVKLDKIINGKK